MGGAVTSSVSQHRRIEEEIKRKEAEIRDQERLGLNSDEDSGVSYCCSSWILRSYLNKI